MSDERSGVGVVLACLEAKGAPDLRCTLRILQQLLWVYSMALGSQRVLYALVGLWVEEQRRNFSHSVFAYLLEALVRHDILLDVEDSHTVVGCFRHSLDTRPLHRSFEHPL